LTFYSPVPFCPLLAADCLSLVSFCQSGVAAVQALVDAFATPKAARVRVTVVRLALLNNRSNSRHAVGSNSARKVVASA
jgi:hypothetical protein